MNDQWKTAAQIEPGDTIAAHYGKPRAVVLARVTGQDETVLIIKLDNSEKVRYV